MNADVLNQQELFEQYSDGNSLALERIAKKERMHLYDYLVRMTLDPATSSDLVDLALSKILNRNWNSLYEFRFDFYYEARKIGMQTLFHKQKSYMENASLRKTINNKGANPERIAYSKKLIKLDQILNNLCLEQKEILCLHSRCQFSMSEISQLTQQRKEIVEELYQQGLLALTRACPELKDQLKKALQDIPLHLELYSLGQDTLYLNSKMQGINTSFRFKAWHKKIILLLALLITIALLIKNKEQLHYVKASLKGLWQLLKFQLGI